MKVPTGGMLLLIIYITGIRMIQDFKRDLIRVSPKNYLTLI
jgi:hypothetical protein